MKSKKYNSVLSIILSLGIVIGSSFSMPVFVYAEGKGNTESTIKEEVTLQNKKLDNDTQRNEVEATTEENAETNEVTEVASGTSGTVKWELDSNGLLLFSPISGNSGTFSDDDSRPSWLSYNESIKTVKFEGTIYGNASTRWMFEFCTNLTSIDFSGFDTSNVQNMQDMFRNCSSLTSLDLSGFNTSNVTNMFGMFRGCESLASIDLSSFDTGNVKNMNRMFSECYDLSSLDVSSFNTMNVTDMGMMFDHCNDLTSLDLSGFDTRNVTDMNCMFDYCISLASLDVSNFNTGKVTDMNCMFEGCESLASLDVGSFDSSNVTDMHNMFYWCEVLNNLDLSSFDTTSVTDMNKMFYSCPSLSSLNLSSFDTRNVANMNNMFYGCSSLSSLDLSGFHTGNVTDMGSMFDRCSALTSLDLTSFNTAKVLDMSAMFYKCSSLTNLDLSSFDTRNVTNMEMMFSNCSSLISLDLSNFNTGNLSGIAWRNGSSSDSGMFSGCSSLTSLDLSGFDTSNVTCMCNLFNGCSTLTSLDLSSFDTSNVTDMFGMFSGCSSLTSLDLSGFDTSKVTDMKDMFWKCSSLTSLNLSGFKTGNVESMIRMFGNCSGLNNLNISSFDTSNVKDMERMFSSCSSLKEIDVHNFNTSNVKYMEYMFSGCSSLTKLDLSNFDTSNVTDMTKTFSQCSELVDLDISSFTTSNVKSMSDMFSNCSSLTSLDVSNFDTSNVTSMGGMFSNCSSLTSLDLSSFDTSHVSGAYSMLYKCESLEYLITPQVIGNLLTDLPYKMYDQNKTVYSALGSNVPAKTKLKSITGIQYGFSNTIIWQLDEEGLLTISPINDTYGTFESFSENESSVPWYKHRKSIKKVVFEGTVCGASNMSNMFNGCSEMTDIDLNGFTTRNVQNMSNMFKDCSSLTSLNGRYLNTGKAENMTSMFSGCSSLTNLDLSSFDTHNVGSMSRMFANCSSLVNLNLSNFDTSNVTDMSGMFYDDRSLQIIYVSEKWNTEKVASSTDMFTNCTSLPNFDAKVVDKTKAHYEEGGYLTYTVTPEDPVNISLQFTDEPYSVELGSVLQMRAEYKGNQINNFELEISEPSAFEVLEVASVPTSEENTHIVQITAKTLKSGEYDFTLKNGELSAKTSVIVTSDEDQPITDGPNSIIYQAQFLAANNNAPAENIHKYLTMDTPSQALLAAGKEHMMDFSLNAWKAVTVSLDALDDPTTIAKMVLEPKDIYTGIIMSILNASADIDFFEDMVEDSISNNGKIVKLIQDCMSNSYGIDVLDSNTFKTLSDEQMKTLLDSTGKWFKETHPLLARYGEVLKGFTTAFKIVDNIEDYSKIICNYMVLANMNEYTKAVLQEVYNESLKTNNTYLKSAVSDCLAAMNTDYFSTMLLKEGVSLGKTSAKYLFKEVIWEDVIKSLGPKVGLFMTIVSGGKDIANFLFAADDINDAYRNLKAVLDVEEMFKAANTTMKNRFLNNPTTTNASNYLLSLQLAYSAIDEDCEKAYSFVKTVNNGLSWVISHLSGDGSLKSAQESIRNIQSSFRNVYSTETKAWLNYISNGYNPFTGKEDYSYIPKYLPSPIDPLLKQINVACPVDVYVYDSSNNLAGSVINGFLKNYDEDHLMIGRQGDEKIIRFYTDENYTLKLVGTDTGNMDVQITEYSENEDITRTTYYEDIPLTEGKEYDAEIPGAQDSEYEIIDDSSISVEPAYDTAVNTLHKVSIKNGLLLVDAEPTLSAEIPAGKTVTVQTQEVEGYKFIHWSASNNQDIFADRTSMETSFVMPDEDIVIEAKFESESVLYSVELNKTELTLRVGKNETLIATVIPEGTELTWSSSDPSVATVDQTGKVTAVADTGIGTPAQAEITATVNGSVSAKCIVTVEDPINGFVRRLYKLCFNRTADPGGFRQWTNGLRTKKNSAAATVRFFFTSQEFKNLKLNDEDFVEMCYQVMMDRASDAGGKKNWVSKLDIGMSQTYVLRGFIASREFSKICADYGITVGSINLTEPRDQNQGITEFVSRCYSEVLGRKADTGGLNDWCNRILTASSRKQAAINAASNGFFHSEEYMNKHTTNDQYVRTLYRTFLGREADTGGYNDWMNKLRTGTSRDIVMKGFANSTEFANIMAKYGIK